MSEFEKELENVEYSDFDLRGSKCYSCYELIEYFKDWQPPKPLVVVPQIVADFIKAMKIKGIKPLMDSATFGEIGFTEEKRDEILHWINEHQEEYMQAWIDDYTVEKPQLFYLKNKIKLEDVGSDLIGYLNLFLTNDGYLTSNINRAKKFTQQEIDSMQTGIYEKIEV